MRRIAGTLVLFLVMALGAPMASGNTNDPDTQTGPKIEFLDGSVKLTLGSANRVEWTPERAERARPVTFTPSANGAPRSVGRADPLRRNDPAVVIQGSAGGRSDAFDAVLQATGGMVQFDRFTVLDPSSSDYAMHGKVYMLVDNTPTEAVCSASVVPSVSGMVVFTAAHCLMSPETGQWILDGAFVPGYLGNDENPYAFWPMESLYVTQEWYESSDPGGPEPDARYDIAAFTVQQYPYIATNLQDTVGYRGVAFNIPQGQSYQSFGYPAAAPFDGEKMISCISAPARVDTTKPGPPLPNGMGCDMTGGSSGGGWVIDDAEGYRYLNSVVSYATKLFPQMQFGPYFGQVGLELFEDVSGYDYPDVEEPGVEEYGTGISLRLRRHLKATGVVTSPSDECKATAPIVVAKIARGEAKFAGQGFTKADGSFSIKLKDRPGKYVAAAVDHYGDSFSSCAYAETNVVKHGH
jgi:V8-like Glu-specific endopeptidase